MGEMIYAVAINPRGKKGKIHIIRNEEKGDYKSLCGVFIAKRNRVINPNSIHVCRTCIEIKYRHAEWEIKA